ncbi:thioredoxin H2-like [Juglans microcarpa x Juglans regia]|uniref:thioredoxin H2-like n=1 Tax=Juglans microcarpa x Juglans regia TaxID=2249226 RepID=UPI001B7DC54A|nr:thioredoxin H2-like [Juglans microcarpa x Juglans regia]
MGGNVYELQKLNGSMASRVTAFHSKEQWKSHVQASKDTNKLSVVYFTATWCGACRFIEPAFKEFSAEYKDAEFIKIDVDELESVAWGLEVGTLPTFLLVKKGKVVERVVGVRKDELQKMIVKHGA